VGNIFFIVGTAFQCESRSLHRIRFKFKPGSVPPYIPNEYVSCIGGCDQSLNETLGCTLPRSTAAPSGGEYVSLQCCLSMYVCMRILNIAHFM